MHYKLMIRQQNTVLKNRVLVEWTTQLAWGWRWRQVYEFSKIYADKLFLFFQLHLPGSVQSPPVEIFWFFQPDLGSWANKLQITNTLLISHQHCQTFKFHQNFCSEVFIHLPVLETEKIGHILLSLPLEGMICLDTNNHVDSQCSTMSSMMV